MHITGDNFGHEQGHHLTATVGGRPCVGVDMRTAPLWINHTALECMVPEGTGGLNDVSITVSGQTSEPNKFFKYHIPEVHSLQPMHSAVKGGDLINVTGLNFGTVDVMQTVFIGGKVCQASTWVSDRMVSA
jgi:hypothetical protein